MRKLLSLLMAGTFVLLYGRVCSADEINGTDAFNLIDYCETHDIKSRTEFQSILELYVPQSELENVSYEFSEYEEESFEISIDYEEQTVSTITIYSAESTRGTRSGSAVQDVYSGVGIKIYSVTVRGTFTYGSGNVSTTSASGSFDPATLSPWTSNPTISSGKTGSKAYARISGTATWLGNTSSYCLTLTCDTEGNLDSY